MAEEFESLDKILEKHIPSEELKIVQRLLYGSTPKRTLSLPATDSNARKRVLERHGKKTKPLGLSNQIVLPTSAPVENQRSALFKRIGEIIDVAGLAAMPFAFCTRERLPWTEFAEPAEDGASTKFLSNYAQKYGMVIVSPILERDEVHGDVLWNTAVIFPIREQ
ncbi:Beta-ureidopropionase [Caligus rogercresseyi]|uniref:Beta-ureidopropionase n=1 Tax=Caligus rogercresseyi TaxID=217165 RepID=A0A7T8KBR3_CALRO|nr:Beta-ureidopropionase [Caligus rogercresseyi]